MSEGIVTVRWLSGAWTIIREDDTVLSSSASAKTAVQDAVYYAAAQLCPLEIKPGGQPLVIVNDTIIFPAGIGNNVYARGTVWQFTNGAQPGFRYDTQAYGLHDFAGARTYYSGAGPIALLRPEGSYDSGGVVTKWTRQHIFDLGALFAAGGNPSALILIDPTAAADAGGYLASQVVDSHIRFIGEGWLNADYGVRVLSPSGAGQVVGELKFDFPHLESCKINEILIGDPSSVDQPGTCKWLGNISHGASGGCPLTVHGFAHQFYLDAVNLFLNGPAHNSVFGPKSYNNLLICGQVLTQPSSAAVPILDQGTNNKFQLSAVAAPSPPTNFEGTAGTPSGSVNMGNNTIVDRSWAIDNGKTVSKLWLYTTTAGTYGLKIVRRNSAGNYDVVASQTITHGGTGLESVTLSTPYAVASDGKQYYAAAHSASGSHPAIDMKDRSYVAGDATGSGVTMTEDAAHASWWVFAVGVSYQ